MLEQQVAEIDCKTHTFLGELRLDVLVHRELCPKTDCVIPIDSEGGRPKKDLVCLSVGDSRTRLPETAGAYSNQFSEQSPVPLVRWSTPLRRTVSIDEAVVEHIRTLTSVMFKEPRERTAKPQ